MLLLAVLALVIVPVSAAVPKELEDAAPEALQQIWETADGNADHTTLENGLHRLGERAAVFFTDNFKSLLGGITGIVAAVFLTSLAEESIKASHHPSAANYAPIVGVLAITSVAAGSVKGMMGLAAQTIEELDVFGKALLPTLAAATAAGGGVISAGVRQVTTVVFSNLLLTLIHRLLMPLVYFYVAALAADTILPEHPLQGLAAAVRKTVIWALTGLMTLFAGYLTVSGVVASSGDVLTMRLAKSAVSTAVPVVGSIISEATGSVLAGAFVLKNSVGIFGILGILAACLSPFITIGTQYLLYKIVSFLCGITGQSETVRYVGELGGAFGLMLGMVASCGLLLLLSVISSISAVIQ